MSQPELADASATRIAEPAPPIPFPARPASKRRIAVRAASLSLLGVVVLINLHHVLPQYLSLDPASSRSILRPALAWHYPLLLVHLTAGNIAMVTVFLQLWPGLRRRYPRVHRISGRVYVFAGALPSAAAGLVMVGLRPDPAGSLGLTMMGLLWILTTVLGYRAARERRYVDHRRWMIYSFALAIGTTWGRVLFLIFTHYPSFQMNLSVLIETANWLCWVVDLAIAHWWLERTSKRAHQLVR